MIDWLIENPLFAIPVVLVVIVIYLLPSKSKDKMGGTSFASKSDVRFARKKAVKQMFHRKHNSLALSIGEPSFFKQRLSINRFQRWFYIHFGGFLESNAIVYVPEIQRGVSVWGGAGTGKTYSVLEPLARQAFREGIPVIAYDFKYPVQAKRLASYAKELGYKVFIFAPGYEESGGVNVLNFIKDEFDAITAKQICEVIQKNIGSGNNKSDPYFDTAAVELFVGVLLLTKAIQAKIDRGEVQMNSGEDFVSDLLTAQIILNQPDFAALMEKIDKSKKFDSWTMGPFKQIISLKSSEKTGSIVISIVQKYFNLFMRKRYLPAFCGNTTIPLDLEGKILLICGLDRNTRDVVSPLMATVIHMIVTRNVSKIEPRKDPLIVMLDEFPTLYLPQLPRWLNENREQGFCGILGAQNRAQLVDAYGEQMAKIVFAGTATKFLFDPQDEGSASDFSKYLGNKEVVYETYSHSFQGGKKTGRTVSEQRSNKALFDPSDFLQLPRGNCIFINPMYGDRKKGSVPLRKEIKVSKKEILAVEKSIDRWKDVLKENEEEAKEQNVAEIDLQVRQNDIEIFLDSIVNEKEDVYF